MKKLSEIDSRIGSLSNAIYPTKRDFIYYDIPIDLEGEEFAYYIEILKSIRSYIMSMKLDNISTFTLQQTVKLVIMKTLPNTHISPERVRYMFDLAWTREMSFIETGNRLNWRS